VELAAAPTMPNSRISAPMSSSFPAPPSTVIGTLMASRTWRASVRS